MIDITKPGTVFIGRKGENHYRNIEFDVSGLLGDEYPEASLHAIYQRPDGTAYPVVTDYADGVLTWSPGAADTSVTGVGRLEIRMVYGEVVGKSVQLLTIVEEALEELSGSPPEPPAQEWLNQVLSVLSGLYINETQNLLSQLNRRTGILLNHWHPIETATAPDMASRRAAITFTSITAGNNMVLGTVTYTFVVSMGTPAANNVQVLIQGTLRATVMKLAEAIRGVQDEINIAYGTGTAPNPVCTAYWTGQRFSVGDATIGPGESLFALERAEDVTTTLTFTTTATATISVFTRASYARYVMSGNVSGAGGTNSIRGPLHTVLPINSVVIGGQGGQLYPTTYDCHLLTLCRQSDTSEKELDLYISNDEVTFTRISRSTPVGADSTAEAQHIHIEMRQSRVPVGYGLYIRMGSGGTSATAYCDLKFTYHLYPVSLVTDIPFDL